MERFVKGDIVVLPFPHTDLSITERRPGLVVSNPIGEDVVICQITTKSGPYVIPLNPADIESGELRRPSFIKPAHIFSLKLSKIYYKIGRVTKSKWKEVSAVLVDLFK